MGFFALLFLGVVNVTQGLVCRKDATRFSSKVSSSHFYECGSTNTPELKKCPGSEVYHIKRKDCVDARDLVAENAENEPALGRNIQLGALYDARTRMFYPEASPWRKETIRDKNQTQIQTKYPASEVFASNRVYEKMQTVGVSASIGASILGGLVKVTGSASYFNDLVIQDNEVNIELLRTSELYFVTLPSNTHVDYPDECSPDTTYTHAVTQVFYGMDAHFVFKNTVKNRTESDFSAENLVETSYVLTEYEQAKTDIFGYLDDVASDIRGKSSFCGFTEIVGEGAVSFDRVTADSNVDGASIDGGTGLVTVGAEASYQVSLSLEIKTDPGSSHKLWVSKNGENMDESLIDFSTDVFGMGESVEWGSRNIVLQLLAGGTINVVQEITGTSTASNLSFCVALIKA